MTMIVSGNDKQGWAQFTGAPNLDAGKVARLVREGIWTDADLAKHGLKRAEPFTVPQGKQVTGAPRFEKVGSELRQVYDVEDMPPEEEPGAVLDTLTVPQIEQIIAALNDEIKARDKPEFGGKT